MTEKKKAQLLLVDDDPLFLKVMESCLTGEKIFTVCTAMNGNDALVSVEINTPDIILMDFNLGEGMDGIECMKKIRKQGFKGPVFMLTGDKTTKTLRNAILAGANDYIVKADYSSLTREIVEILIRLIRRVIDKTEHDAIEDSGYLSSMGLTPSLKQMLSLYSELEYPREKDLAQELGITHNALWKRLARIRRQLDVDSMPRVVYILETLRLIDLKKT